MPPHVPQHVPVHTSLTLVRSVRRPLAPRGLTLLEILIVIAILLAIGSIVAVNVLSAQGRADIDITKAQMQSIEKAMQAFKVDLKRWPTQEEGLTALWSKDAIQDEAERSRWRYAYLEKPITADQWGTPYIYRFPGELNGEANYDLISSGPDRQENTEDDITNAPEGGSGSDGTFDDFRPANTTG